MPVNILEVLNSDILSLKFLPFLRAKDLQAFSLVNKRAASYFKRYCAEGLGFYVSKDSLSYDPEPLFCHRTLSGHLAGRLDLFFGSQHLVGSRLTLGLKQNHELLNAKTLEENLLAEAIGRWAGKGYGQKNNFFYDAEMIRDVGTQPDLRLLSNALRRLNIYWPRRLVIRGEGQIWQPDWEGLKIFASKTVEWHSWVLVLEDVILRERDFADLLQLDARVKLYLRNTWMLSSVTAAPKQITFLGKYITNIMGKDDFLVDIYLDLAKSDLIYDPDLGYGLMREIGGKQYIYSFYQSFKQPLAPNILKDHPSFRDRDMPYTRRDRANPSKMYLQGTPFGDLDLGMQIKIQVNPLITKGEKTGLFVEIPPLVYLSEELVTTISRAKYRAEDIIQDFLGAENLHSLQVPEVGSKIEVKSAMSSRFALFLEFLEIMLVEDLQLRTLQLSEFKSKIKRVADLDLNLYIFRLLTDDLPELTARLPRFYSSSCTRGVYGNWVEPSSYWWCIAPSLTLGELVNIQQAAGQHIALKLPEDLWPLALMLLDVEVKKLVPDRYSPCRAGDIVQILEKISLDLRLARVCEFMEKLKAYVQDFKEEEQQRLQEYVCSFAAPLLELAKQEELLAALQPPVTFERVLELLACEQASLNRGGPYNGTAWLLQELLSMELSSKLLERDSMGLRSKSRVLVSAAKKYLAAHRSSVAVNSPSFWAWCLSWLNCCESENGNKDVIPARQIEGLFGAIAEQVSWLCSLDLTSSQIDTIFKAGGFCLICLRSREDILNEETTNEGTVREFLQDFIPLLLKAPDMNLWAEWLGIMLLHRGLSLKELKDFMQDLNRRAEYLRLAAEEHLANLYQEPNLLRKFKSIYDEEPAAFLSWGLSEQMEVFFGSPLMAAKKKTGSYRLPDEYSHLTQLLFAGREKIYKTLGDMPPDSKEPQLSYNVLYLQELASNFTRRGEEYLAAKVAFIESLR